VPTWKFIDDDDDDNNGIGVELMSVSWVCCCQKKNKRLSHPQTSKQPFLIFFPSPS
jgi:hypothetical protein